MPSVEQLKQRLAQTLETNQIDAALGALTLLARAQPEEPSWPRRAAKLLHARRDREGEVAALRRALELQVDQGLVLDAIASCTALLEIVPDDAQTLDTLDLLYVNGPSTVGSPGGPAAGAAGEPPAAASIPSSAADLRAGADEPLDSLLLTDVVPGSRAVRFAHHEAGPISEIPVDDPTRPGPAGSADTAAEGEIIDLKLERIAPDQDLRDLAAAQAVSLPPRPSAHSAPRPGPRRKPRARDAARGASLRSELANLPLFGDLDPASLYTLIRKVRVVSIEAGQVLFRQGDAASSLYVVVEGAVVPIAEGERRHKLAVLERGAFFGEIGLMTKQPRNATIEAIVDTKLLVIDRRVVWGLIKKEPAVAKSLLRFLRARLIDRQIRTHPFFSAFAHAERETVARQFRVLEVQDGARIATQGKPAEGLFVVLAGSFELVDRASLQPRSVGELGLGDVFGGLSLLEGQAAATDVVARGKSWVVMLGEGRFRRIVEQNPCLVRILRRLAQKNPQAATGVAAL